MLIKSSQVVKERANSPQTFPFSNHAIPDIIYIAYTVPSLLDASVIKACLFLVANNRRESNR